MTCPKLTTDVVQPVVCAGVLGHKAVAFGATEVEEACRTIRVEVHSGTGSSTHGDTGSACVHKWQEGSTEDMHTHEDF